MRNIIVYIIVLVFAIACSPKKKDRISEEEPVAIKEKLLIPADWIEDRVEQAKSRLSETEASRLVWQSIEAHGGLEKWFSNGVFSFRFNYMPLQAGLHRDSYQSIDTWSARAVHTITGDEKIKFGWDGTQAWKFPATADLKIDARFWALTPYYFVGVPFVFADKGIKFELLEDEIIESAIHNKVKVSFDTGIGDAPDDYYILYIDEETKLVDALIYVVSYPKFFPGGGHSEEKFMDYIGEQTIDGITLAKEYKTYLRKKNKGFIDHVTDIELSEVSFSKATNKGLFDKPNGAVVVE